MASKTETYKRLKTLGIHVLQRNMKTKPDLYISGKALSMVEEDVLERIIALHNEGGGLPGYLEQLPVFVACKEGDEEGEIEVVPESGDGGGAAASAPAEKQTVKGTTGFSCFKTSDPSPSYIITTRAAQFMCSIWRDIEKNGQSMPTMRELEPSLFLLYYCEELAFFTKRPGKDDIERGRRPLQKSDMTEHGVWTAKDRDIIDNIIAFQGKPRMGRGSRLYEAAKFVGCMHIVGAFEAYTAEAFVSGKHKLTGETDRDALHYWGLSTVSSRERRHADDEAGEEEGGRAGGGGSGKA